MPYGLVASSSACCIPKSAKQSEKKLLRLWLTTRIFFVFTGIALLCLLINSFWTAATLSFDVAIIVVGLEFVLLGAITTPRCCSASSIKMATLGLGGNEEATSAAKLVFAPLVWSDGTSPGTEMP